MIVVVLVPDGVTLTDAVAATIRVVGVTLVGEALACVSPKS